MSWFKNPFARVFDLPAEFDALGDQMRSAEADAAALEAALRDSDTGVPNYSVSFEPRLRGNFSVFSEIFSPTFFSWPNKPAGYLMLDRQRVKDLAELARLETAAAKEMADGA